MKKIYDLLDLFDVNSLYSYISEEIKQYIGSVKNKKNIVNYFMLNIDSMLDNDKFLLEFSKKCKDIYNFEFKGKDKKEIKKQILSYFDIGNSNIQNEHENLIKPSEIKFFELLDYQYVIKEKVSNFVYHNINKQKHVNKLIIHMPTGTGKTKTSIHTIISLYQKNKYDGTIIWLAHTNELLQQAYSTFTNTWKVLGRSDIKVEFNNLDNIHKEKAIYFLSYQKLIYFTKDIDEKYKEFRKNVSICVCDEAHKCLAGETYKAIDELMLSFDITHPKTLIGLTATPGRKYRDSLLDGENLDLALMFDKNIFSINVEDLNIFSNYYSNTQSAFTFSYSDVFNQDNKIIKYFQDRNILSKIKRLELKYDEEESSNIYKKYISKKHKNDYNNKELLDIGNCKKRNEKIIEYLEHLEKRNIPTILFACSNEQGKLLSNILTLKGIKNRCVFGDTKKELREEYLKDFEDGKYNILINNTILTTGFDSPRIRCVFITRPTNSIVLYSQMIGRGLRGLMMGGNEKCLLIDVVDNLTKYKDENEAFNYFEEYWR